MNKKKLQWPKHLVIPTSILFSNKICAGAKIHYGFLFSLSSKQEIICTDDDFSKLHNVSKGTITQWQHQLQENNLILSECENIPYRDNENRLLFKRQRTITLCDINEKKLSKESS